MMSVSKIILALLLSAFVVMFHHIVVKGQGGLGQRPPQNSTPVPAGAPSGIISPIGRRPETTKANEEIRIPSGVHFEREGEYSVSDPRPLEPATALIQQKLGIPISYEDIEWASADVISAADHPSNRNVNAPGWRGPLIPRGGDLRVYIPASIDTKQPSNIIDIIARAVDSYRANRNPGSFQLIQFGVGEYAVIPAEVIDADRNVIQRASPLSYTISFPEQERSLQDTVALIAESAGKAAGVKFVEGSTISWFRTAKVRIGAQNETAREVLSRTFRYPLRQKISWSLHFDPQNNVYGIFLRGVQAETQFPDGVRLMPVFWGN
jgi:hypothetical protein